MREGVALMAAVYCFRLDTPAGRITLREEGDALTHLQFGVIFYENAEYEESHLLREAARQLNAYFNGTLQNFSLPLHPEGTEFQRRVCAELQTVPYGQTRSYGDIARACGNVHAARAVGMANNRNPLAIIIPCHRVIGANGKLVGYGGGLNVKAFLLDMEKKTMEQLECR